MRVREVQIGTFRKFLRNAHDGGAIALTSPVSITSVPWFPTTIPMLGKSRQRVYVLGHVRQGIFGHERLASWAFATAVVPE